MLISKTNKDKLEQLIDKSFSIKERAAMLAESLAGIDPNPDLNGVLESIVNEDSLMKAAYKDLCRDISEEVFILLSQINDKKIEAAKIDVELLSKEQESNRYCSIYAKVPPLQGYKDDAEYRYFLGKYEQGMQLSQEIAKLNFQVIDLLDVQRVVDNVFASSIVEMDYLIKRLTDIIRTFKYAKTPDLIESYKNKYCAYKELQQMIDEKNREFEVVLNKTSNIVPKESKIRFTEKPR